MRPNLPERTLERSIPRLDDIPPTGKSVVSQFAPLPGCGTADSPPSTSTPTWAELLVQLGLMP